MKYSIYKRFFVSPEGPMLPWRDLVLLQIWGDARIKMRVLWTARRSNQSILKEVSLGISLGGMMLKLKLQYFGHLMWRVDSLEKILMLGGIRGRRKRGWQRMRWLDGQFKSEFGNKEFMIWATVSSWSCLQHCKWILYHMSHQEAIS